MDPVFQRHICLACELSDRAYCEKCGMDAVTGRHAAGCSNINNVAQGLCTICTSPLNTAIRTDRTKSPPINTPTLSGGNYCGECAGDLNVGHASTCSQYTGPCPLCNAPKGQCKCGTGEGCAEDAYALERAKRSEKEKQTGRAISAGLLCPWCGPITQGASCSIPQHTPHISAVSPEEFKKRLETCGLLSLPGEHGTYIPPPPPEIPLATGFPQRTRLPNTRASITRKNACGTHEFYVTVGFYDEPPPSRPGEIFVKIAKEGSVLGGMCDVLAVTLSLALQYGVPWDSLREKYLHTRFEPQGSSLDSTKQYPSIAHAIADTVDAILAHQKAIWST